jgi:hypothetical protein
VSGPGSGYWLRIYQSSNTLEFFAGATDGTPQAIIDTAITPGGWHHVVGTKDTSGLMSLYLDGQPAGTANITPTFDVSSSATFTLGAWNDRFGVVEHFSGLMDQISIYNKALPKNEVVTLFNSGGTGKCN